VNNNDERVAAILNSTLYNSTTNENFIDASPHLKHRVTRELYGKLVAQVYAHAHEHVNIPRVLDLGAGDGSATLPFLELGAKVTAIDISENQLTALLNRCKHFGDNLDVHCIDISHFLLSTTVKYDVIVTNSLLHHIPDYLNLIRCSVPLLAPSGQFFSFQDPLRYDTLGMPVRLFCDLGYLFWRSTRGNIMRGVQTRIRRVRGIYSEKHEVDFAEYHVVRNGVDQNSIIALLEDKGFCCTLERYFSTQSRVFQYLGNRLGIQNRFAVIACKNSE
jgi:SAM-dependent methyltransferase